MCTWKFCCRYLKSNKFEKIEIALTNAYLIFIKKRGFNQFYELATLLDRSYWFADSFMAKSPYGIPIHSEQTLKNNVQVTVDELDCKFGKSILRLTLKRGIPTILKAYICSSDLVISKLNFCWFLLFFRVYQHQMKNLSLMCAPLPKWVHFIPTETIRIYSKHK